jgi:hypothetical protein
MALPIVLGSIFMLTIVLILKSLSYWLLFRFRTIGASGLTCLMIAGYSMLLMIVPMPLPFLLKLPVVIGLGVFLTMHYTGVRFLPDGLLIPLVVEGVFYWLMRGPSVLSWFASLVA